MTPAISSLSKERVLIPVRAREDGEVINPTDPELDVAIAFVRGTAEPEAGDWEAATWDADNGRYAAEILVGPGGTVTLAKARWTAWVKITRGAETVIRRAGPIEVQ